MFNRNKDKSETSDYEPFFTADEPIAETTEQASWNNYDDAPKKKSPKVSFTRESQAIYA